MEKKYLCIDVGGSSIKYAIMDRGLRFFEKGNIPTPYEGIEKYLDVLEEIYQKYSTIVSGIAMSVPGIIDSKNGICITGGNLTYIKNFPLGSELEKRCEVPVTIMNDAKAAAMAEAKWGALSDCNDGVVIVLGTGVGGAFVKNGEVHMGKNFSAGEFSFIMTDQTGNIPKNTWGILSGKENLNTMAAMARGENLENVTGFEVFKWANEGDERVLEVLDSFTKTIAQMIINLQLILDPDRFVIGGGISQQSILMEYIQKNLDYYYSLYPTPFEDFPRAKVQTCQYFNDSNLIGALGYYLSVVEKE
ncbi:MAG: ROK family protein [Lachnospiraceae bacterium]